MDTASLPLCKELFEVSAWEDCIFNWYSQAEQWNLASLPDYPDVVITEGELTSYPYLDKKLFPAYDLGYLLRKLQNTPLIKLGQRSGRRWSASAQMGRIEGDKDSNGSGETIRKIFIDKLADTPENACALLAIELFKEGILTK